MKLKHLTIGILSIIAALTLAACGGEVDEDAPAEDPATDPTMEEEAPMDEPAEEPEPAEPEDPVEPEEPEGPEAPEGPEDPEGEEPGEPGLGEEETP